MSREESKSAQITIVPTPIGNLEDISLRALKVLKNADYIAAEDTRTSKKLLNQYQILTPLVSLHQHNEHKKVPTLVQKVQEEGLSLAVISDAGTPGISDPGYLIVKAAIDYNLSLEVLPGPTAFIPALVASGLPFDRFVFEGFLPVKKGRVKRLKQIETEKRTMVFYESPYRILKTLKQFEEILGENRAVCVAKEISKIYEFYYRGSLKEVILQLEEQPIKGEFVIVLAGK